MGVSEKVFTRSNRWRVTRPPTGPWVHDAFGLRGEAPNTLLLGARLDITKQFGVDQCTMPAYTTVQRANETTLTVSYLWLVPQLSHIEYKVTAYLAKPTAADGRTLTTPLLRPGGQNRIAVFDEPDFDGMTGETTWGPIADGSRVWPGGDQAGAPRRRIRSFVVLKGLWVAFRDEDFQRAYTRSARSREPIFFGPGLYPDLSQAGLTDGVRSLLPG